MSDQTYVDAQKKAAQSAGNLGISGPTAGPVTTPAPMVFSSGGGNTLLVPTNLSINGIINAAGPFVGYATETCTTSTSPHLPPIILEDRDENYDKVTMTLCPEPTVSTQEALKLMMLLISYCQDADKFSSLGYIKANNLERHFKFSQ